MVKDLLKIYCTSNKVWVFMYNYINTQINKKLLTNKLKSFII